MYFLLPISYLLLKEAAVRHLQMGNRKYKEQGGGIEQPIPTAQSSRNFSPCSPGAAIAFGNRLGTPRTDPDTNGAGR
jgi:hypothetical protein